MVYLDDRTGEARKSRSHGNRDQHEPLVDVVAVAIAVVEIKTRKEQDW